MRYDEASRRKTMDIKDTAVLLAQAYNDQNDIYIISDSYDRGIYNYFCRLCNLMNNKFDMYTSVVYTGYPGPVFRDNDLVIHIGYNELQSLVESRRAFYLNVDPNTLDYLIPAVSNALIDLLIGEEEVAYG
jgi:hypothetical protein